MQIRSTAQLVMLVATLFFALAATPSPAEVKMSYTVGFGDQTRPGVWTPVFVTLSNEPDARTGRVADFIGRVEVRLPDTVQDRGVTFSAPVELPANARKRVVLYVKLTDQLSEPRLHVVRPNGTDILNPQSLTNGNGGKVNIERNPGIHLSAVVLDQFDQMTNLASRTQLGRQVRNMQVLPGAIPEKWYGLQALDVVVLPSLTEDLFTPAQIAALAGWVRSGGDLVIVGGTDVVLPPTHPIMEIMPVEPLGLTEVDLLNIQNQPETAVISEVVPQPGAVVTELGRLANGRTMPLGYRRAEGLGAVHYWCFSPRQRLNSLDVATQSLWEVPFLQDYSGYVRDIWLERFRPTLFRGSVLEGATQPPNVFVIGILIVIYFIVVGPMNFYVLQKKRRVELAWVTIPAIVLVFSIGMYSVGVLTMGSENLERDFTLIQMESGSPHGRETTLTSVFAARSNTTDVDTASTDDTVIFANFDDYPSPFNQVPRSEGFLAEQRFPGGVGVPTVASRTARIAELEGMRMESFEMPQWLWSAVQSERVKDFDGVISADIRHYGDRIAGSIDNSTQLRLQDAFVVTTLGGGPETINAGNGTFSLIDIGDVPAGGSIELPALKPETVRAALPNPDYSSLPNSYGRFREAVKYNFVSHLGEGQLMPKGRVFLFGFVELDSQKPVSMPMATSGRSHLALVSVHVPIRPESDVVYPFGHMNAIPVATTGTSKPGWGDSRSGERSQISMTDAEVSFVVESPFELGSAQLADMWARVGWTASGREAIEWESTFRDLSLQRRREVLAFGASPSGQNSSNTVRLLHLVPDIMRTELQAWPLRAFNVELQSSVAANLMSRARDNIPTIRVLDFGARYE